MYEGHLIETSLTGLADFIRVVPTIRLRIFVATNVLRNDESVELLVAELSAEFRVVCRVAQLPSCLPSCRVTLPSCLPNRVVSWTWKRKYVYVYCQLLVLIMVYRMTQHANMIYVLHSLHTPCCTRLLSTHCTHHA